MLEVDIVIFTYSLTIFTKLRLNMIIIAASHVSSQLTSHISLSVRQLYAEFPVAPLRGPGRLDSAILLIGLYWGGHLGYDQQKTF